MAVFLRVPSVGLPYTETKGLGADSPFFSTIVLFNHPFSLSGGFLERRIPGNHGEGTLRKRKCATNFQSFPSFVHCQTVRRLFRSDRRLR